MAGLSVNRQRRHGPAMTGPNRQLDHHVFNHSGADGMPCCTTFRLSFETGYIGTFKWYPGCAVKVNKVTAVVQLAIEATADGTITMGNATGASDASITVTKAAAIGTVLTAASPTTNNTCGATGYIYFTTAKANAGGNVLITVQYSKTGEWAITS